MTPTEQLLRTMFADDAELAPTAAGLAADARQRVRRRRAWLTTSVATAGFAAATLLATTGADHGVAPGSLRAGRAVPDPPLMDCASTYSDRTLSAMPVAFDGTVTSIGLDPARDLGPLPSASVAFRVHEWFRGGGGPTVRLEMTPPDFRYEDSPPAYRVGTRLLVSGRPRRGGASLDDLAAWGCGFTRYYDPATARAWREVFAK